MRRTGNLDEAIAKVVDSDLCSGCGACVALDEGLEMRLDQTGYSRPVRREQRAGVGPQPDSVSRFRAVCPGAQVRAQNPPGSRRDAILGPVVQAWEAHAADERERFAGSSGGALTALSGWLVATGRAHEVIGAQADRERPRRTVSVRITTRDEALSAAGSRYAPVSNAALSGRLTGESAFVGKPCEVSAVRALGASNATDDLPILLSFFCAGTPSQHATDDLVEKLGVGGSEDIRMLRYRGHGWPGDFTVVRRDGEAVAVSYDESWGRHLGPTTQWRCKICPDGVGESADVSAADFWRADERGYPDFSEGAGSSALIARTERGRRLVLQAEAEGVIRLGPLDLSALVGVQPLQRTRRQTLLGRLVGVVVAGGAVPRFRGFGLVRLASPRMREIIRTPRGTYRRRRTVGRGSVGSLRQR